MKSFGLYHDPITARLLLSVQYKLYQQYVSSPSPPRTPLIHTSHTTYDYTWNRAYHSGKCIV